MNFVAKCFLLLPRRLALKLGILLGILAFYILRRRRKLALDNFNQALGKEYSPTEQKKIIKKVFINLGLTFVEFLRFAEITKENLSEFVTFHGKENVDCVYAEKKGVLALTAHMGNWELLAASISLSGINSGMLVKSAHQKFFDDFLTQQRTSKNLDLVSGKNSVKLIFKLLKAGTLLGVVIDQHGVGRDSVVVPFFGRPASTLKGLAILSERTGCPVIPIYTYRDENLHHHVVFDPPIQHIGNSPESRTLQYNQWLESVIRQHPEQWMWTHNRWKTTPASS
ncbi:MAG TPA: lysophospholipid acyltransferase family protein [Gammaproteobacteria bacterium]|nr:lysophospholipid acyltransferase family protein [Gammaproteobacteria bacterium]